MNDSAIFLTPVWLSFVAWVVAEWRLAEPSSGVARRRTGILWLAGALAMTLHVVAVMDLRHDWSHAAAVADTARQTAAVTGVDWGGGVWVNYLFVVGWWISVGRGWMRPERWEQPGWVRFLRRGVFGFMWINGAFVFVPGPQRWVGLLGCSAVALRWVWTSWRPRLAPRVSPLNLDADA